MDFSKLHKNSFTRHLVVGLVIFSILFFFILFSNYGLVKRFELEIEANNLKNEIKNLDNTHDSLLNRIIDAETDTFEIEKVAREKYGLIKPGEKIYFIEKDTTIKLD